MPAVLAEMLSLPTASFVETAVMDYLRGRCGAMRGVKLRADAARNLLAHYRHEPPKRPAVVFTAHTDHPGFVAGRMTDDKTLLAEFRGWVEPDYFVGTGVRFFSGGWWVKGRVTRITKPGPLHTMTGRTPPPREVAVEVRSEVARNSPGMWDLPEPALKGELVHARGCDDIAGCAAMVALLERLSARRAKAETYCLFTRAEEVGFIGAIAAARLGTISKKLPVVAIETSKALPGARQGDGPVLRVGDKTSIFPADVTAFCDRVAKEVAKKRKDFKVQRKLMDGGTCESTAYVAYGYRATGMCVALGNYHNMDERRRRIAPETIHLGDWNCMVDWFEALVMDRKGFGSEESDLRKRLDDRYRKYEKLLMA